MCAAVGFSLVLLLNDNEKLTFDLSPFFLALVAFCFSMTVGVMWEFFEFGVDRFLNFDKMCIRDSSSGDRKNLWSDSRGDQERD